ncbi:serine hydrolase domain-containing protein [Nocardiopsis sediminis]|uniref:Beta-lactamase n=1 Tax=Nocardiopsis sediminis TaxID=1778267 RepID=A0ABV8FS00_9ACTN
MTTPPAADRLSDLIDVHARPLVTEGVAPAVGAALIRGDDEAVLAIGRCGGDDGPPADGRTVFEVGSLSKTFTALLLAVMAAQGDVAPADPLDAYLPPGAAPRRSGPPATLTDLATHTSGLPRLPRNLFPRAAARWLSDPYARYSRDDLYRATGRARLKRSDPPVPRYSTFGTGLLGQVLADSAGTGYPALLADRVLAPLGMRDSDGGAPPGAGAAGGAPDPGPQGGPGRSEAVGHRRGRPVGPWHFDALAGAGAVRCTPADMLLYLRAHLDPAAIGGALPEAVAAVRRSYHPLGGKAGAKGTTIGLAWNQRATRGHTLYWHTGATGGFTAFAGFSPTAGAGVAVLANATPVRGQPVLRAARRLFRAAVFPDS